MIGLHFSSQQPFLPKTARQKDGGQALRRRVNLKQKWVKIYLLNDPDQQKE
jgi:hypothetical protein